MRVVKATTARVKEFEGTELRACVDRVGVPTIGQGGTERAGFGPGVTPGDSRSEAQADGMRATGQWRLYAGIFPLFTRKPPWCHRVVPAR